MGGSYYTPNGTPSLADFGLKALPFQCAADPHHSALL
jgi:hypothetical protein